MKKESLKEKKSRAKCLLITLKEKYPNISIQLRHENPFELLIATILSAQCTDVRVNIVTKDLFQKYKRPTDYINVSADELEGDIFSTGFYKAKARNIRSCCQRLISDFGGLVPANMDDLLSLGGVGRKTANVVLGHGFGTGGFGTGGFGTGAFGAGTFGAVGIVVDTHVKRISNRLKLTNETNPTKIEFALMKVIDRDIWIDFTHYFIMLGREVCTSRKAKCEKCPIAEFCPSAFKVKVEKNKKVKARK